VKGATLDAVTTAIQRRGRARAEMAGVLILTAFAGALSSKGLMRLGVDAIWLRYAISVLPAYLAFFCLVGVWVRVNRSHGPASPIKPSDRPASESISPFDALELIPDLADGCATAMVLFLLLGIALIGIAAIYYAPTFLAELLLESAFAGSLYRPLRGLPAAGWPRLLLRRTYPIAILTILIFAGIGALLHEYAPEARSIGGVIQHWRGGGK
jgi:hypothetical protein